MSRKTPEQIDAEIERLKEEKEEAKRKKRERAERAVTRAADRAGLLAQEWASKDLEPLFRAIARDGSGAVKTAAKPASEPASEPEPNAMPDRGDA